MHRIYKLTLTMNNLKQLICIIAATFVLWGSFTVSLKAEGLVVNEIMAANIDQFVDPSYNYGSWVELYNPTQSTIAITGWYFSDDDSNLMKAKIHRNTYVSSGSFITLWFGKYSPYYAPAMIDLELDPDGGVLYLSDDSGAPQLEIHYPAAVNRCSWARTTDAGEDWSYAFIPTPSASNSTSSFSMQQLEAPEVSEPSQVYSGSLSFKVEVPEGCTLKYVLNGAAPNGKNGITSNGSFTISRSTRVYRFRLFKEGYLPSPVVTRTFIYQDDKDFTLPIISSASANDNFYGDELGFFTQGTNGRPGRGQSSKCNWNMDWERPASFEYIDADGTYAFSQEVDIERVGGWSRAWLPYSFKIKANSKYDGNKYLNYSFFTDKPYLRNKSLQIRNGGNDNNCRIKDPALQEIVRRSGIYVDGQAYQPVVHFVNAEYKGLINMREPNNKDFARAEYGLDSDELDMFEMSPDSGYVQVRGTKDSWNNLLELSRYASNASYYNQIREMVDIDEYINYMAVLLYLGNTDWPQNNVKGFKSTLEGGKFHFVLFDTDHAFNTWDPFNLFADKQNYTFDLLYGYDDNGYYWNGQRKTLEIEFVTLFLNLLNNSSFRKQFIDSFCLVAGSVFEPSRCQKIITELCNRVSAMQAYDNTSPWGTANSLINSLSSDRQYYMIYQLKAYSKFNISGLTAQSVQMEANIDAAHLLVNGLPVPTDKFNGSLFRPAVLEAQAPAGYRFVGWKNRNATTTRVLDTGSNWLYYDKGSLDGQSWFVSDYNTGSWKSGAAPLGYFTGGSRDYQTTLNYGGNSNSKYPTYYFRHSVTLSETPVNGDYFILNFICDDGFVLYVNGQEVYRYNMPGGTVSFNTFSSSYAPNNPDYGSVQLDADLFRKGDNVIAVEVHNNAANSTDIYWESSLDYTSVSGGNIICSTPKYTLPQSTGSAHNLIACFEAIPEAQREGVASHPVVINEVSASNGTYVNEFFKKNDWIELYNTTDEEIDLAGMYLTDNLKKPQMWQIAADNDKVSTIIPAHGYKLIWCDKLTGETQLHAPFKLGNDDRSELMLSAADGSWRDTLNYCAHSEQESVGRYPDGGNELYVFSSITPAASNRMTTYTQSYSQPYIEYIEEHLTETAADVTRHYKIYDLNGRMVKEGEGSVEDSDLPGGMYIVKRGRQSSKIFR